MELIEAASAELARVVRLLPAGSWDLPTPVGVTVRELVEHVVAGNWFTVALPSGRNADAPGLGDDGWSQCEQSQ